MQHRQAGKPHFAACIHAEFLNFLRIRKTKAENQSQPEASGTWLWFVFGYFGCFMALPVQANIGKGLLQIFVLLQQLLTARGSCDPPTEPPDGFASRVCDIQGLPARSR